MSGSPHAGMTKEPRPGLFAFALVRRLVRRG